MSNYFETTGEADRKAQLTSKMKAIGSAIKYQIKAFENSLTDIKIFVDSEYTTTDNSRICVNIFTDDVNAFETEECIGMLKRTAERNDMIVCSAINDDGFKLNKDGKYSGSNRKYRFYIMVCFKNFWALDSIYHEVNK